MGSHTGQTETLESNDAGDNDKMQTLIPHNPSRENS